MVQVFQCILENLHLLRSKISTGFWTLLNVHFYEDFTCFYFASGVKFLECHKANIHYTAFVMCITRICTMVMELRRT